MYMLGGGVYPCGVLMLMGRVEEEQVRSEWCWQVLELFASVEGMLCLVLEGYKRIE